MTDTTTSPKYDVLVADPPWDIEQKGKKRGAEKHYNLMSLQDIKDMGDAIKSVTADDSHCWLWVTNATLRHGYDGAVGDEVLIAVLVGRAAVGALLPLDGQHFGREGIAIKKLFPLVGHHAGGRVHCSFYKTHIPNLL